jgi:hypothetical protein
MKLNEPINLTDVSTITVDANHQSRGKNTKTPRLQDSSLKGAAKKSFSDLIIERPGANKCSSPPGKNELSVSRIGKHAKNRSEVVKPKDVRASQIQQHNLTSSRRALKKNRHPSNLHAAASSAH